LTGKVTVLEADRKAKRGDLIAARIERVRELIATHGPMRARDLYEHVKDLCATCSKATFHKYLHRAKDMLVCDGAGRNAKWHLRGEATA
jgi:hypothetical protein